MEDLGYNGNLQRDLKSVKKKIITKKVFVFLGIFNVFLLILGFLCQYVNQSFLIGFSASVVIEYILLIFLVLKTNQKIVKKQQDAEERIDKLIWDLNRKNIHVESTVFDEAMIQSVHTDKTIWNQKKKTEETKETRNYYYFLDNEEKIVVIESINTIVTYQGKKTEEDKLLLLNSEELDIPVKKMLKFKS